MNFSHPAFDPYRALLDRLPQQRLASIGELNSLAQANHLDIRFAESASPLSAAGYELGIQASRVVPTRPDNLHDFMNALVWMAFPEFKWALNRAHCHALKENRVEHQKRSPLRDALTVLDESGVVIFTLDPGLSSLLANHCWHRLFVEQRSNLLASTRFYVVGHSVLEKLVSPYLSITGKCLVIPALPAETNQASQLASQALVGIEHPGQLPALPVAGIPGWHPGNHLPRFYDNTSIFRPLAHPAHTEQTGR